MSDVEAEPDGREARVARAISAARRTHLARYGTDAVDEAYIRSLPDWMLDRIIGANPARWDDN